MGCACTTHGNELRVLTSPEITVLYPRKGNVHQFTAGEDGAAVLDVLVPPYDDDRDCTFYGKDQESRLSEWCEEDSKMLRSLRPIEQPLCLVLLPVRTLL